jgi:uncharacterized membrane protein YoaK (UPF0700 family)
VTQTHPIFFVIVGVILAVVLIAYARRSERRLQIVRWALPVIGVAWCVVDFITTPPDRWVTGIALALAALVGIVAFGYERFRGRPKASAGQ